MEHTPDTLPCWIYRSSRKQEMYLYLRLEDRFDLVPLELLERFGRPEFVMQLDLGPGRRLARADVETVMRQLRERGYHLQMPPRLRPALFEGD